MARPITILDEDILAAAREVFLTQGVRATAADVAKRARISEGTIFNRFKTRDALFRAALHTNLAEPREIVELPQRAGHGRVEDNLQDAATALAETLRVRVPLSLLAWSDPGVDPRKKPPLQEMGPPTRRAHESFTAYVEAEIELGRLRRLDPALFSRALVGGLMEYVLGVLGLTSAPAQSTVASYVRELIELLLHGAANSPAAGVSRQRRAAARRERETP